jgi:hypothetical protein
MHGPLDMGWQPKAMPLNDIDWVNKVTEPRWDIVTTSFRICIWPRKCHASKKNIWIRRAYRVRHSTPRYDMEYYNDDRWYDKHEYLKLKLMG